MNIGMQFTKDRSCWDRKSFVADKGMPCNFWHHLRSNYLGRRKCKISEEEKRVKTGYRLLLHFLPIAIKLSPPLFHEKPFPFCLSSPQPSHLIERNTSVKRCKKNMETLPICRNGLTFVSSCSFATIGQCHFFVGI